MQLLCSGLIIAPVRSSFNEEPGASATIRRCASFRAYAVDFVRGIRCLAHGKRTFAARLIFIIVGMRPELAHKTYILRVWQVERDALPVMVAALEDCQTDERHAFPSLAALVEFLEPGCDVPQKAAVSSRSPDEGQT